MTKSAHTPWKTYIPIGDTRWIIEGARGHIVADCGEDSGPLNKATYSAAHAALIVRAVNCHNALVDACKWAEAALAPFSKEPAEKSGISKLRAALKQAGVEEPGDM